MVLKIIGMKIVKCPSKRGPKPKPKEAKILMKRGPKPKPKEAKILMKRGPKPKIYKFRDDEKPSTKKGVSNVAVIDFETDPFRYGRTPKPFACGVRLEEQY